MYCLPLSLKDTNKHGVYLSFHFTDTPFSFNSQAGIELAKPDLNMTVFLKPFVTLQPLQ